MRGIVATIRFDPNRLEKVVSRVTELATRDGKQVVIVVCEKVSEALPSEFNACIVKSNTDIRQPTGSRLLQHEEFARRAAGIFHEKKIDIAYVVTESYKFTNLLCDILELNKRNFSAINGSYNVS